MHIVIPMSGRGQRFLDAGYTVPKPLIEMDGRPMLAHVIDCFPEETNFTFICSQDHLEHTQMRETILKYCPTAQIVAIQAHKLGPVYAVSQIYHLLQDEEEVIVNYCDFGKYWDYKAFLADTRSREAAGAIAVYRGFHPHMLGTTNYAFCREEDRYLLEIREKEPFTSNRMQEYASDGTYYFRSGSILKKFFTQLMERKIATKGEYYVSMVYNLLVEAGLKVSLFEIEHMLQWGTPEDVLEYNYYSNSFRRLAKAGMDESEPRSGSLLIPMAGAGSRFAQVGFTLPKPLIEVKGKPMILQAMSSLPRYQNQVLVVRSEHRQDYPLEETIRKTYANATFVEVKELTRGQACSVDLGLDSCPQDQPLFVGACDNALVWDTSTLDQMTANESVQCVILTFRDHPGARRNPKAYGWVRAGKDNRVESVSVKVPISESPHLDPAVVGAFWFRSPKVFRQGLSYLLTHNITVNNEFYVDSLAGALAETGLDVRHLDVDDYLCFGTPEEWQTFHYWQSFFSKVSWHPYEMLHCRALL